jgi:uncharacterized protein (DUF1800 family)
MTYRVSKRLIVFSLALGFATPAFTQTATKKSPASSSTSSAKKTAAPAPAVLTERQRAIHALNRLTFGPRPGDVDAVMAKGLDGWIEDQLHPESINDAAVNGRLGPYATTRMDAKQLALSFPDDGVLRQVMTGKRPMPTDADLKLVYSVNIARLQQQDANKGAGTNPGARAVAGDANGSVTAPQSSPEDQARAIADRLLALPKEQRLAALENVPPEQLVNFSNLLRADQRDRLNADATPHEREIVRALANPAAVVVSELQQAKVMREIYSERQLQEVMTDFWFNHFNVFQNKNQDVYYTTAYERDVIRPRVFGKFYDLLIATAQSPAMLMYLDNWLSAGTQSEAAGKNRSLGLNENYGREVMELHTLGVDGGYTQADVTELARILTGWTIAQPDDGGQFQFDPARHEPGPKTLLGETLYGNGVDQGLRALYILAHHPATAHFISKSIAIRFVADDPPEALVNRMAATFQASDGDIREVMRAMLHSDEFWSPQAYRAKLKTPNEYVVSAVRASGANVVAPDALLQRMGAMGMQPYGMAVPTGYSMRAETWQNSGALLARINYSTQLAQGNFPGVQFDPASLVTLRILQDANLPKRKVSVADRPAGLNAAIALIEDAILQEELPAKDESIIQDQMKDPDVQRRMNASPLDGLRLATEFVLGSPEFQRR